jgi:uncharacterized repeat protein (TIGR04138 family)
MEPKVSRSSAADLLPLAKLLAEDQRYKIEAYQFVGAGLEYAQEVLGLGTPSPAASPAHGAPKRKRRDTSGKRIADDEARPVRHITGQELCWALKELAHRQYGRMARLVLGGWGLHSTSDFGEIVYNLIQIKKMSKSEHDRRQDFDNVYDFDQALVLEYAIRKEEEPCRP